MGGFDDLYSFHNMRTPYRMDNACWNASQLLRKFPMSMRFMQVSHTAGYRQNFDTPDVKP